MSRRSLPRPRTVGAVRWTAGAATLAVAALLLATTATADEAPTGTGRVAEVTVRDLRAGLTADGRITRAARATLAYGATALAPDDGDGQASTAQADGTVPISTGTGDGGSSIRPAVLVEQVRAADVGLYVVAHTVEPAPTTEPTPSATPEPTATTTPAEPSPAGPEPTGTPAEPDPAEPEPTGAPTATPTPTPTPSPTPADPSEPAPTPPQGGPETTSPPAAGDPGAGSTAGGGAPPATGAPSGGAPSGGAQQAPGGTVPGAGTGGAAPGSGGLGDAGGATGEPVRTATLTTLAEVGTAVVDGTTLHAADGEAVVAVVGDAVQWRALDEGVEGPDVRDLEEALAAAGVGDGLTVDEEFTAATGEAVQEWEESLGRADPDRRVEIGDLVAVAPGYSVVARLAEPGDTVRTGSDLLGLASAEQVALVEVPADEVAAWTVGATVDLTRSDGAPGAGTVREVGRDVTGGTVEVSVTPADPTGLRGGEPVTAGLVTQTRDAVPTVPVSAIVSADGGTPAVRLDDGRLVEVRTGLVAGGRVEVTGVTAGDRVQLPS